MKWILIVLGLLALAIVLPMMVASGICSRQEEKQWALMEDKEDDSSKSNGRRI